MPFLINFVKKIDQKRFEQAMKSKDMTVNSYDPKTQTSHLSLPTQMGSYLTYTETGLMNQDTKQSDT